jgi:hypothetical protein
LLNISGDITEAMTVDLTKVSTSSLTFWDNEENAIDVASGAVLQIHAGVANNLAISGAGTVDVRDAQTGDPYNFSTITAINLHLTFANAGQLNASTDLTGVDQISLAEGTTEMSGSQADGREFSGLGGVKIHDETTDNAQHYKGTAFADTIIGSGGDGIEVLVNKKLVNVPADTVDLSQGGQDTVVFSGDLNDLAVTGMTFGMGNEADVLNFSNLSASLHNTAAGGALANANSDATLIPYQLLNMDQALPSTVTGHVIGFTGVTIEDERSVANLFTLLGNALNNKVNVNDDLIFLIANTGGDTNIWHWQDQPTTGVNGHALDGNVQFDELTRLGSLMGVDQTDIATLLWSNISNIHFVG